MSKCQIFLQYFWKCCKLYFFLESFFIQEELAYCSFCNSPNAGAYSLWGKETANRPLGRIWWMSSKCSTACCSSAERLEWIVGVFSSLQRICRSRGELSSQRVTEQMQLSELTLCSEPSKTHPNSVRDKDRSIARTTISTKSCTLSSWLTRISTGVHPGQDQPEMTSFDTVILEDIVLSCWGSIALMWWTIWHPILYFSGISSKMSLFQSNSFEISLAVFTRCL